VSPEHRTWLVHQITEVRFTPCRIREGYLMADVDRLLDRLVAELEADRPVQALASSAGLTTARWREAYRIDEVDRFLAEIASGAVGE